MDEMDEGSNSYPLFFLKKTSKVPII